MWKEKPDERYLWIQGNIFKHGFIVTVLLLMLNMFVQSFYGAWASPFHENVLLLWVIIDVVSVESIWREVYAINPRHMKAFVGIIACCGLLVLGLNIYHLAVEGQAFVVDGQLSETGSSVIMSGFMLCIPLVALAKRLAKRGAAEAEEE